MYSGVGEPFVNFMVTLKIYFINFVVKLSKHKKHRDMKKMGLVAVVVLMTVGLHAQEEQPSPGVYFENGKASKNIESLGTLSYQVIHYYDNGQVREMGYTKDGKRHGLWLSFDTEGKLVREGYFDASSSDGKWRYWNSEGELLGELADWDDTLIKPSAKAD